MKSYGSVVGPSVHTYAVSGDQHDTASFRPARKNSQSTRAFAVTLRWGKEPKPEDGGVPRLQMGVLRLGSLSFGERRTELYRSNWLGSCGTFADPRSRPSARIPEELDVSAASLGGPVFTRMRVTLTLPASALCTGTWGVCSHCNENESNEPPSLPRTTNPKDQC